LGGLSEIEFRASRNIEAQNGQAAALCGSVASNSRRVRRNRLPFSSPRKYGRRPLRNKTNARDCVGFDHIHCCPSTARVVVNATVAAEVAGIMIGHLLAVVARNDCSRAYAVAQISMVQSRLSDLPRAYRHSCSHAMRQMLRNFAALLWANSRDIFLAKVVNSSVAGLRLDRRCTLFFRTPT